MFTSHNPVAPARFDARINGVLARKAGFLFVNRVSEVVAPEQAEALIAFVPGLVFAMRDGSLSLVPLNSEYVTGGDDHRDLSWLRGGWLMATRLPFMGQTCQHVLHGRVGKDSGTEGGFRITSPSMARTGDGTLEERMIQAVRRASGLFWEFGPDFVACEDGLQEMVTELSRLLGVTVTLDLKGESSTAQVSWIDAHGKPLTVASARDSRKRGSAGLPSQIASREAQIMKVLATGSKG